MSAIEASYAQLMTYRGSEALSPIINENLSATFIPEEDAFDSAEDMDAASVTRKSTFRTAELNYRTYVGSWWGIRADFLFGLRYASFSDRLDAVLFEDFPCNNNCGFYSGLVRNRMFGAQVGGVLTRPIFFPGLGVKFDFKVALMGNRVRAQHSMIEQNETNQIVSTASRLSFATVIESGLFLTYQPWANVMIHAGSRSWAALGPRRPMRAASTTSAAAVRCCSMGRSSG